MMKRADYVERQPPHESTLAGLAEKFLYSAAYRYINVVLIRRPDQVQQIKDGERYSNVAKEFIAFIAVEKHGDQLAEVWGYREFTARRETSIYRLMPARLVRVPTSIPINWGLTDACSRRGEIKNLSITGCYIETNENRSSDEMKRDQQIFILWQTYLGEHYLRGEVKYNVEETGFGVSFVGLSEKERKMLMQLINDHLKTPPK